METVVMGGVEYWWVEEVALDSCMLCAFAVGTAPGQKCPKDRLCFSVRNRNGMIYVGKNSPEYEELIARRARKRLGVRGEANDG